MLVDKYRIDFVEMGGMLREEAGKDTPLGKDVDRIMNKEGKLVPDEITYKVITNRLKAVDPKESIVIDGFPRTADQKDFLDQALKDAGRDNVKAVYIKISDNEAIERISKRLLCKDCKSVHIKGENDVCKKCGGKLIQREDDTPAKVATRLEWTHEQVDPIIEDYKQKGILVAINGEQSIEDVHKEILSKLDL